ncbi:hypothetical protein K2X30_05430 [bacterium]|jgi:hypothetical protein|nr:hypothetical protein [bacterium]
MAKEKVAGTESSENLWLIRTNRNVIAGPYSQEQVQELVTQRQLTLQDEICPANGYWMYLHEREEVQKVLGVAVPRLMNSSEEEITETETQTETQTEIIEPSAEVLGDGGTTVFMPGTGAVKGLVPIIEETLPEASESVAMNLEEDAGAGEIKKAVDRGARAAARAKAKISRPSSQEIEGRTFVISAIEKPSYLKMFTIALVVVTVFSLIAIFVMLN